MKNFLSIAAIMIFLSSAVIARGEEFPVICELKEVLNFNSPLQVIFLRVDMKNRTVNGIPSTVLGDDIITYETETEALTIIMPTMDITVVRKARGMDNADIRYTGICYHDRLIF
ncbi:hypothetical protein ACFLYW_00925 [Thermodesulfobacteriota bacterium]